MTAARTTIAPQVGTGSDTMSAGASANDAIPRAYNFAIDILGRNLDAGRAAKPAFIDPRGTWTYGQLADRVERFGKLLRALGMSSSSTPRLQRATCRQRYRWYGAKPVARQAGRLTLS